MFQLFKKWLKINCPSFTKSAFTTSIISNIEKYAFKSYLKIIFFSQVIVLHNVKEVRHLQYQNLYVCNQMLLQIQGISRNSITCDGIKF